MLFINSIRHLRTSIFLSDFTGVNFMASKRVVTDKSGGRRDGSSSSLFTYIKILLGGTSTETRDYYQRPRKSRRIIKKSANPFNGSTGSSVDGNHLNTSGTEEVRGRSADEGGTSTDERHAGPYFSSENSHDILRYRTSTSIDSDWFLMNTKS